MQPATAEVTPEVTALGVVTCDKEAKTIVYDDLGAFVHVHCIERSCAF
jgi:hypothetical protein